MQLLVKRVDHHAAAILTCRKHLTAVDEISRARLRGECRGRVALRRSALERTAFRLPLVEPAIEHGEAIEAEGFEHPPESRRPHRRADGIEHDETFVADAVAAEGGFEPRGRGHHE